MSITQAQAATRVLYTLVPLTTIIAWKAQAAQDAATITHTGEILVESENDLKEAQEESVQLSKELITADFGTLGILSFFPFLDRILYITDFSASSFPIPLKVG